MAGGEHPEKKRDDEKDRSKKMPRSGHHYQGFGWRPSKPDFTFRLFSGNKGKLGWIKEKLGRIKGKLGRIFRDPSFRRYAFFFLTLGRLNFRWFLSVRDCSF